MQLDPSKFVAEGLTYDDVLLLPAYSEVLPRDVDTGTFLNKKDQAEHPYYFGRDGYRNRICVGYCHCAGRRHRYAA